MRRKGVVVQTSIVPQFSLRLRLLLLLPLLLPPPPRLIQRKPRKTRQSSREPLKNSDAYKKVSSRRRVRNDCTWGSVCFSRTHVYAWTISCASRHKTGKHFSSLCSKSFYCRRRRRHRQNTTYGKETLGL